MHSDQLVGHPAKRYHLMRYWKAEESVRDKLKKVIDKHEEKEGKLEVDYDK